MSQDDPERERDKQDLSACLSFLYASTLKDLVSLVERAPSVVDEHLEYTYRRLVDALRRHLGEANLLWVYEPSPYESGGVRFTSSDLGFQMEGFPLSLRLSTSTSAYASGYAALIVDELRAHVVRRGLYEALLGAWDDIFGCHTDTRLRLYAVLNPPRDGRPVHDEGPLLGDLMLRTGLDEVDQTINLYRARAAVGAEAAAGEEPYPAVPPGNGRANPVGDGLRPAGRPSIARQNLALRAHELKEGEPELTWPKLAERLSTQEARVSDDQVRKAVAAMRQAFPLDRRWSKENWTRGDRDR